MKRTFLLFSLLLLGAFKGNAQLAFEFSAEGGYAGSTVKSDELPVFLAAYNSFNGSTLSKQFDMKSGAARGSYCNFTLGMGSSSTKGFIGFGRYLVRTPDNEARFTNGEGRNISVELKDASTEVGFRFDSKRFTASFQMDMIIRTVSVYSQYVFPDGSKSLSDEHSLNGIYSNSRLQVGLGGNVGFRVIPHLYIIGKFDYIFQTDKSHPEYHMLEDLQMFRTGADYLPRDMTEYTNNSWNSTGNSLHNDIRGLRFSIGLQFMIANNDNE